MDPVVVLLAGRIGWRAEQRQRAGAGCRRAPCLKAGARHRQGGRQVSESRRCPRGRLVCAPRRRPGYPRSKATRTARHRRPGRSRRFTVSNSIVVTSFRFGFVDARGYDCYRSRDGVDVDSRTPHRKQGCTLAAPWPPPHYDGELMGWFFWPGWVRSPVNVGPVATRAAV